MKRPLLATLGIAGACAACCAIPLALPLLAGFSAAGLTALDWRSLSGWALPLIAGIGTMLLVGVVLWAVRRRRATSGCSCRPSAEGGR